MSRARPAGTAASACTAAVAMVAVLAAGCGSATSTPKSTAPNAPTSAAPGSPASAPTGSITVFAAASLTQVLTDLGKRFEATYPATSVRFSFGASSTLAQQILAGAPADIFAAASPTNMAQVTDAGAATIPKTFATNVAQIAVAPTSAGKVTSIGDLGKPGVKVALCQPQVPCGALAQAVLAKAKVAVSPVTEGLDVKGTLAYVTGGEVDAAIVYATDVRAAGARVTAVDIPAAANASTAYPIATVATSRNPVTAAAFEDFVLSATGQRALREAGFSQP